MATERYVVVSTDTGDKVIKDGPLLWDGVSDLKVGAGLRLILATAADQGGYTRPTRPITELNAVTLRERIGVGLTASAVYTGLANPTAAQTAAQVRRLSLLTTALAKYMLDQTGDTDGT